MFKYISNLYTQSYPEMFLCWDTSHVKISKPKHLLLVNIELLFDGKQKEAAFMDPNNP